MRRILFVCLGNICRSPTAEAVFRQRAGQLGLADKLLIDSAGTGDWHLGKAPDPRAIAAAARRGYDLSELRARQVAAEDFSAFDIIVAMDTQNLQDLQALQPASSSSRIELMLSYGESTQQDVPDPYYGGEAGFERVIDLIEEASDGLLNTLVRELC